MLKPARKRDYEAFGHLLREVRKGAGFTQVRLAKRMREDQATISRMERGVQRVDLIELQRFCRIFGISLTEFVGRFEKAARKRK